LEETEAARVFMDESALRLSNEPIMNQTIKANEPSSGSSQHLRSIRVWILIFIGGLVISGITAFPLQTETAFLVRIAYAFKLPQHLPSLNAWLGRVAGALADTNARYPFLAYGTDWLAFGHLVIALAFIGAYLDPVRNRWLITFGLISCAGVVPLALIAGAFRGIPLYWRAVDSSFGVLGCIPLLICRRKIALLERGEATV